MNNLPKTSDVKGKLSFKHTLTTGQLSAIDVMILVAMAFIFASLLELALVGYLTRNEVETAVRYRACD